MFYCPKCKQLAEDRCPSCHKVVNAEPKENDPVLAAKLGGMDAGIFMAMLDDEKIPYLKSGRMGDALTTYAGSMLEEYSIYVPYGAYEKAMELLSVLTQSADGEE